MNNASIINICHIQITEGLLWWLMIICLSGTIIIGTCMYQILGFVINKKGDRVSLIALQTKFSVSSVTQTLSSISEKGRDLFKETLTLDFLFMPFLYLTMTSLAQLARTHFNLQPSWDNIFFFTVYFPLIIWVLDVIENYYSLTVLSDYKNEDQMVSRKKVVVMAMSSILKWLSGLVWLILMITLLITYFVEN